MNNNTTPSEQSDPVFVGGLEYTQEYCIIVGETSLCGTLFRRLGHRNGAERATHWDFEVNSQFDAENHVPRRHSKLCDECKEVGGWEAAPVDSEEGNTE